MIQSIRWTSFRQHCYLLRYLSAGCQDTRHSPSLNKGDRFLSQEDKALCANTRYALLLRFLNTTTVLQVSRVGIGERVGWHRWKVQGDTELPLWSATSARPYQHGEVFQQSSIHIQHRRLLHSWLLWPRESSWLARYRRSGGLHPGPSQGPWRGVAAKNQAAGFECNTKDSCGKVHHVMIHICSLHIHQDVLMVDNVPAANKTDTRCQGHKMQRGARTSGKHKTFQHTSRAIQDWRRQGFAPVGVPVWHLPLPREICPGLPAISSYAYVGM